MLQINICKSVSRNVIIIYDKQGTQCLSNKINDAITFNFIYFVVVFTLSDLFNHFYHINQFLDLARLPAHLLFLKD